MIEAILQVKKMPKVPADTARKAYISAVSHRHKSFQVRPTGLHLHTDYPYLGASSDGLVSCLCCGPGLVEIKCPYNKRDVDPTAVNDKTFYLKPLVLA